MKEISIVLGFILLLVISASCNPEKEGIVYNGGAMSIDFFALNENNNSYKIEKIIPLETRDTNLIGNELRIKFHLNEMFVFDEKIADAIHKFDSNGNYLAKVVTIGEGPNTVSNIKDFVLSEAGLEVLVGKGAYSEVITFSLDDNTIVNELKLDITAFSMEKISNGNYIFYAGHNYPIVQNRVYIVDSAGTIVSEHLPNDYKGLMMPVIERNFFSSNDEVFFREAFNPNVYKVEENKIEEKYKFNFGQYNIPSKFWEIDITEGFSIISSQGFAIVDKYYESNRYSFFTSIIQKESSVDSYHIILDKQDSSIHKKSLEEDRFGDVFRWPIGFDESNLIFAVPPPYLIDNIEELNLDDTLLKNVHFERSDNPILVFCNINHIVE